MQDYSPHVRLSLAKAHKWVGLPVEDETITVIAIRFELFKQMHMRTLAYVIVPNIADAAQPEIQCHRIQAPAKTGNHFSFFDCDLLRAEFFARVLRKLAA